jgi:hypothetical protein
MCSNLQFLKHHTQRKNSTTNKNYHSPHTKSWQQLNNYHKIQQKCHRHQKLAIHKHKKHNLKKQNMYIPKKKTFFLKPHCWSHSIFQTQNNPNFLLLHPSSISTQFRLHLYDLFKIELNDFLNLSCYYNGRKLNGQKLWT